MTGVTTESGQWDDRGDETMGTTRTHFLYIVFLS
jgi:hypothetical protein